MRLWILAAAAAILTACAATRTAERTTSGWVPKGSEVLEFTAGPFAGTETRNVIYQDGWETSVYANARANGWQGEAIYVGANLKKQAVVEIQLDIEDALETWTANANQAKEWKDPTELYFRGVVAFIRSYRLTAENRSCFAFNADWNPAPGDVRGRPRRATFGYVCAPPGVAVDQEAIDEILTGLGVGLHTKRRRGQLEPVVVPITDSAALRFARGEGRGGAGGNTRFPLRVVYPYRTGSS